MTSMLKLRATAIWGSCITAVVLVATISMAADPQPGFVQSDGGRAGNLSVGCLPRAQRLALYYMPDKTAHPNEQRSISKFPDGFVAYVESFGGVGPVNFIVDRILQDGDRQVLRGHLVDMRGQRLEGIFYASPQDWNCELHVVPGK